MSESEPRTFRQAITLLVVLVAVPAVLVSLVAGAIAAAGFPLGLLGGLLITKGEGQRLAPRFLATLPPVAALSALAAGSWWWVPLFVALGAVAGSLSPKGRALPVVQLALLAATAPSLRSPGSLAVYAAFMALGALFGVLVARHAGAPLDVPPHDVSPLPPVITAVFGAVTFGAGAAIAVGIGGDHSYWFLVMVLVLLQLLIVDARAGRVAAAHRLIGTVIGVTTAVPISALAPRWVCVVLALVLLAVGLSQPPARYWLASAAISTAVVLVASPEGETLALGARRVLATAMACVLLAIAVGGLHRTRTWKDVSRSAPS